MKRLFHPVTLWVIFSALSALAIFVIVFDNTFDVTEHTKDLFLRGVVFAGSAYCFFALAVITLLGTERKEWNALAIFLFGFMAAWGGYATGLGGNYLKVFSPPLEYFDSWRTVMLITVVIGLPIVTVNAGRTIQYRIKKMRTRE